MDEPLSTFRTPGTLPVTLGTWYEQREAARFSLYRWHEYLALPPEEQAGVVAYFRVYHKLEALISQHQEQKMQLSMPKVGKKK